MKRILISILLVLILLINAISFTVSAEVVPPKASVLQPISGDF